jgi:hypothetical protein
MLNVLQAEHRASRSLIGTTETVHEQASISAGSDVSGSYSLRITVK